MSELSRRAKPKLGRDYPLHYDWGMRLLTIIATASLALSSNVSGQSQASTLEDRLKSINAAALTESDCNSQITSANGSNALELIYGSRICAIVKKPLEASFLLLVGQLRAASDIILMPPATQADDRSLMPLYGILYYGGGLNGIDDDILHDPQQRTRLFELLDRWSPSYNPAYAPGWSARKRPESNLYATTIGQGKAELRKNLDRVVRLDSDDQYYALQREYNAILARIPKAGGLGPGTADYVRFNELRVLKRERGIALGVDMGLPPPDPNELPTALDAKDSSTDFPPASAGGEELVISSSGDPAIERCVDQAERTAVSGGGKIERSRVYAGSKWGMVFRADIVGGDGGPQRFTCTERYTGSEPFELRKLQPLP